MTVFEISSLILSAGWLISGVSFALQMFKIYKTNETKGISIITFTVFAFLNANASVYAYLIDAHLWLPGTILAAVSCGLIALKAFQNAHDNTST